MGSPQAGPDLEEWETEEVGFAQVELQSGARIKFFEPWPQEKQPPPTASLLSIASKRGLVAAAGQDTLVVIGTDDLRSQYIPKRLKKGEQGNDTGEDEPALKSLKPQIKISVPRVSHVAFSTDESCLVIAAEQGGGLAVYSTASLVGGTTNPDFQLSTLGTSVRQLLPNPALATLFALVLTNGQLVLADLQQQKLVQTAQQNSVFHEGITCAAWSKMGKQLVAGLEDGTAVQIDQQGNIKDRIPKPPQLDGIRKDSYPSASALPLTSISWLTNNEFFFIYTPFNPPQEDAPATDSIYFYAQRDKGKPFTFRRFGADPCMAFIPRTPAHHFIQRLSDWSPALADALVVTSTASVDVGIFSRLKGQDFVTAMVKEDVRKATLPMSILDDGNDSSAVGTALDFSADVLTWRPIPQEADAMEDAPTPLPAFCMLTTDGIFMMWWFIYNDGLRNKSIYPSLTKAQSPWSKYDKYQPKVDLEDDSAEMEDSEANPSHSAIPTQTQEVKPSPFGSVSQPSPFAAFGQKGTTSAPSQPTFGATSNSSQPRASPFAAFGSSTTASNQQPSPFAKPAFGAPSTPGFGGATALGLGKKSVWGSSNDAATPSTSNAIAADKPTFGSSTALGQGAGFGQVGGLGLNKPSPWGASQSKDTSTSSGGSAFGNTSAQSPFAQAAAQSSGFSTFASNKPPASPFASAGQQNQLSPFGIAGPKPSMPKDTSMGSTATLGSSGTSFSFGQPSGFGAGSFASKPSLSKEETMEEDSFKQPESQQKAQQGGGLFGLPSGGFKLGSTFQGDGTAKDDLPKSKDGESGLFGFGFGKALGGLEEKKPEKAQPSIKIEPGTEPEKKLSDIPAAKPAPSTASKSGEPAAPKTAPDDAPLPPDPTTYKAPKMPDDIPPLSAPTINKQGSNEAPLAGSPPVDLGSERFSSQAGSEAVGPDEEEWDDEEEGDEQYSDEEAGDEEEEGDEEDADEEGEDESTREISNPAALAAFMKRVTPASPKSREPAAESATPMSNAKSSYTPAGLPKGPVFPIPRNDTQASPRSPSPVRAVTSPVRSSTTKALPQQIKQTLIPPAKPVERAVASPKPREPTAGELEDEADARLKELLASPIEPSKTLPSFYTHHEYTGSIDKPGIGGQIEKVFRDVNCMIDVLGLNARSLATFIQGHEHLRQPGERKGEDLDDPEGWCIGEVGDLARVEGDLERQLEDRKLKNARQKVHDLREEEREVLKVKAKTVELRKQIAAQTDPEHLAVQAAAPLSTDVQTQQSELRHGVLNVQKLLAELEEKMTLLRADLATISAQQQEKQTSSTTVPTVEAVTNTILKMTAMVEQRSGDIDVLEAQIKRLPDGIASLRLADDDDYEDDLVSGLTNNKLLTNGSAPASTPSRRPRMAANGDALGLSGMFGSVARYKTPPSGRNSVFSPEASALGRSTGSLNGSARKKMTDVEPEEVEIFNARKSRRKEVLSALKLRLEERGARIVKVE